VTTGPEWGNSYSYDGFGNLLAKTVTKGTAPALNINVNAATNRISTAGYSYDSNGNLIQMPGVTGMNYDVENRLLTASGDQYVTLRTTSGCGRRNPTGARSSTFTE